MSIEFLDCLKRERDISIKPMFSGGKTTFMCTPALTNFKLPKDVWFKKGKKR